MGMFIFAIFLLIVLGIMYSLVNEHEKSQKAQKEKLTQAHKERMERQEANREMLKERLKERLKQKASIVDSDEEVRRILRELSKRK